MRLERRNCEEIRGRYVIREFTLHFYIKVSESKNVRFTVFLARMRTMRKNKNFDLKK